MAFAILAPFLRLFFHLLYHRLAWGYDLVAAAVSLGRWQAWVKTALPYVQGRRALELGHGPGHLQQHLLEMGIQACGVDESRQMGTLAGHRLRKAGHADACLARGLAQALPFPDGTFDTLVSTFPSEYIFDPRTLAEAAHTLQPKGRLVIVPVAWIDGSGLLERFLRRVFLLTGQTTTEPLDALAARFQPRFRRAGFDVTFQQVDARGGRVLLVLATRSGPPDG